MRHNIFDSIPSNIVSDKANVFADFLQTAGLYDSMKISEDNIQDLILLLDGKVRISAYCKECKEKRVFSMKPYIHFEDDDTGCYSQKLSEEVFRLQKSYILENTPSPNESVKKQNTAENGEIVVALIDDEATVKTFYKEKDHIRLQPENSTMDPIIVPNCEILGKVAGVFRKL